MANAVNRINPGSIAVLIEISVARVFDGLDQGLFTMNTPTMHVGVAIRNTAAAMEFSFGQALSQAGQRGDDFVGRTGRVSTSCPIQEWIGFSILYRRPIPR